MDVENFGVRAVCQQAVSHSMHQVGFAQADTAINEQGVVQMAGRRGHMHGCCTCHPVGRALHQRVKSQRGVEPILETGCACVFSSGDHLGWNEINCCGDNWMTGNTFALSKR